jgi:NADPH:quinone reductase-like Zn-dependent oxidoreductase
MVRAKGDPAMTLPATMTALILREDGYATDRGTDTPRDLSPYLDLAIIALPQVGPGQALIKVARAAVNPSDLMFVAGLYGQPRVKGSPAGFEGVGEVVAGDTPLIGQRVSFFGSGSGTWAEYALSEASMMIPLRPDLRDEDAAGLIVNPVTVMAMFDIVRADGAGSFIFTAGGSQLGKFLTGLGKDNGVAPIAVVRRGEQVDALKALGAAEVLVSSAPDFAAQMAAAIKAHGPRILLDAVADQVSADIFFAMPRGACWVPYGRLATTPPVLTEIGQFIFMGKRIEGFWLSAWMRSTPVEKLGAVISEVQARFASGAWRTDISDILPLDQALGRFPAALSVKDAKLLLAP